MPWPSSHSPDRPEQPWILVAEFQTEPSNDDLERVLEYMLRFRRERRPMPRLAFEISGRRRAAESDGPGAARTTWTMRLPGKAEFGLTCRVVRPGLARAGCGGNAGADRIGELSRSVLPWVAPMRGGGMPAIIEEWKRLADLEPDQRVRLDYAADALMFAELPGVVAEWKRGLEGWNVRVSQQVLEWQAEAKVETRRADVLHLLEDNCKAPVPTDLVEAVQRTTDMDLLLRWLAAASKANTFDEFRAATQPNG